MSYHVLSIYFPHQHMQLQLLSVNWQLFEAQSSHSNMPEPLFTCKTLKTHLGVLSEPLTTNGILSFEGKIAQVKHSQNDSKRSVTQHTFLSQVGCV